MGLDQYQTTLVKQVSLKGVGLHSGSQVRCTLHPAPANHGIVFMRSDVAHTPQISADVTKVFRTDMSTTLAKNGTLVGTVEHLMAALIGMGIDNVLVELNGPEVPILDGSAEVFCDAIADAGIQHLNVSRKILRLRRPVSVKAGDKWISAVPAREFEIKASISFNHRAIGEQIYTFGNDKDFRKEISSARTFGFLREVEYLQKRGLALGGSLENAIVLDENHVLNPEGLRFKNEFVRHKVLDALGDFGLLGMNIQASIEVHKSGHELHTGFLKKVLEDPSNYEIVDLGGSRSTPSGSMSSNGFGSSEDESIPALIAAAAYSAI